MPARVCPVCALRNEETRANCLRCGDSLDVSGPDPGGGAWREGDVVVLEKSSRLPERCVRCGAPAGHRLAQTYHWHPPALYLLAIVALLIYAIVATIVRKTARVEVGLCPEHFATRRRAIAIGWALGLLGLLVLMASGAAEAPVLVVVALLLMLAGLITGIQGAATLRAHHIDDRCVRLKGAGSGFLRALPSVGILR